MNVVILRDADEAQRFLLQGLWLQRTVPPVGSTVKHILEWTLEIAAGGQPLPPIGVVADLGHAAYGADRDARAPREHLALPGLPPALMRTYEDHVLGKVYSDWTFERASDAMRRFQGRDRARGLAYVVRQFRDRCSYGGVEMSPGIIRSLGEAQPEDLLRRGWESLTARGPMPLLLDLYESLIAAVRRMAEVLALEDVIALEHRTALADMGQYVAHRQVLQTANRLEAGLPRHKVKPLAGRREVPTRVLDEDTYPVGGFTSISTKGSVESLLHSQLAYMERDPDLRPDLFDVKFLRDELYYYSRDENQFLRRRRAFIFALFPDLVRARFKDQDLPVQRIVMILGLLLTAVRKLSEWLSTDALKFEFVLIQDKESKPLAQEGALLEMLFREQIENHTVEVKHFAEQPGPYADRRAQRSLCHLLAISAGGVDVRSELAVATDLTVHGSRPEVRIGYEPPTELRSEDTTESWTATLERLLMLWV
jgi:vWA domain found in the FtsH ternary systems/N-terminal helical region fused to the FtsH ternary system vWA domain